MSKVVHLSDDAHNRAKIYCKDKGLRMSDWVAALIETAIAGDVAVPSAPEPVAVEGVVAVSRRKDLRRFDENEAHETASVYEAPPFWASRARGAG